jgi:hypothetical protein
MECEKKADREVAGSEWHSDPHATGPLNQPHFFGLLPWTTRVHETLCPWHSFISLFYFMSNTRFIYFSE